MAASKLENLALILYTCAADTLLIEIVQLFISPDNLGSLAAISAASPSWFELLAFHNIYSYMAVITIKTSSRVYARILFHFRPALREKARENLRTHLEARKLMEEARQKPSAFTRFFCCILWPLMIVIGTIFLRKKDGTPLVQGALQRFITVAEINLYIYVFQLTGLLMYLSFVAIMLVILRAYQSRTAEASAAIEEGRSEEVSEVKGGIYNTAANYVIDEKLVDVD